MTVSFGNQDDDAIAWQRLALYVGVLKDLLERIDGLHVFQTSCCSFEINGVCL